MSREQKSEFHYAQLKKLGEDPRAQIALLLDTLDEAQRVIGEAVADLKTMEARIGLHTTPMIEPPITEEDTQPTFATEFRDAQIDDAEDRLLSRWRKWLG